MYLGRFPQGEWVIVPLLDTAWPTDASGDRTYPEMPVFDSNNDVVATGEELVPEPDHTGLHSVTRRLGPEFPAGNYRALIKWKIASNTFNRAVFRTFDIVDGGHAAGAYVGLHYLAGNNTPAIVGMTDGGTIEVRRGPS